MGARTVTEVEAARVRTDGVREQAARELLGWESVWMLIQEAANDGLDEVIIRPRKGHNLKGTKAAAESITLITGKGFKVRWDAERDRVSGAEVPVVVVSW